MTIAELLTCARTELATLGDRPLETPQDWNRYQLARGVVDLLDSARSSSGPVNVARLRALLADATPAPWSIDEDPFRPDRDRVWGIYGLEYQDDFGDGPRTVREQIVETDAGVYPPKKADALLIVEMRNALPILLDVFEAVIGRRGT